MRTKAKAPPRGGMRAMFERILVSRAAAQAAVGLAQTFGGCIRFVFILDVERVSAELTVWTGKPVTAALDDVRTSAAAALRDAAVTAASFKVPNETALIEGDIVDQILVEATAWKADSIVIGTHSRRIALSPALGSKTAELLRHTTIPVLVVR